MAPCRHLDLSGERIHFAVTDPLDGHRTYQLLIEVTDTLQVRIGSLGLLEFPAGYYVYTGSALRNFEARVNRHLSKSKKLHWHIDYLLAAPGVEVREVRRLTERECVVNQRIAGGIVAMRFGASDCHSGCGSHLKRVDLQFWRGRRDDQS